MEMQELKAALEALLFVAEGPLPLGRLREVLECEEAAIREALEGLRAEYAGRSGGLQIVEVAGGFQLVTRPEQGAWVRRLLQSKPIRLSRRALETLAIVAYKQPVTRAEIEEIRGVDAGAVLKTLLERRLIRIVGRMDAAGRPLIYGTTPAFLQHFGLKDLTELPSLREFQEMAQGELPLEDVSLPTGQAGSQPATAGRESEVKEAMSNEQ